MKTKNILGSLLLLLLSIPAFAQWSTNGSRIYYNSGNVGIGISNPSEKLEVDGAVKAEYAKYGNYGYVSGQNTNGFAILSTNAWNTGSSWNFSGSSGSVFQADIDGNFYFFKHGGSASTFDMHMILDDNGNLGIGTSNPAHKLDVDGTIKGDYFQGDGSSLTNLDASNVSTGLLSSSRIPNGSYMISSSGIDGQVWTSDGSGRGRWESLSTTSNSPWTQSGSTVYYNSGNIGIGTASPSEKLEVIGTVKATDFEGTYTKYSTEGYISGQSQGFVNIATNAWNTGAGWNFPGAQPGSVFQTDRLGNFYFYKHSGSVGSFDLRMILDANGNLGIGTSNPTEELDVNGTVKATSFQGDGAGLTNLNIPNSQYMITSSGTSGQVWTSDGNQSGYWSTPSGAADNLGNHSATQNIRLNSYWLSGDGGNEGLRVSSSGNVGIGTASPTEKLDVNGTAKADDFEGEYAKYGNHAYVSAQNTNGFAILSTNAWNTGSNWNFSGSSGSVFQADIDGNFYFFKHGGNASSFDMHMILDDNGNLGIGTSNPTQKLDVDGTVKATSFQGSGSFLTSLNASNINSGTLSESRVANGTYMINSTGTNGQVWTSDGSGRGHWTSPSTGNGNNEYVQYGASAYVSGHNTQGFAHIATNTWHAGGNWNFPSSKSGSLLQLDDMGKFRFYKHNGNSSSFHLNMILDDNGYLGLGTSNPTQKLDVVGTVKAISFQGSGSGLTGFTTSQIPNLDASKITTGTFTEARIPNSTYMIDAVGSNGQVWTSDGSGRGHWTSPSTGNGNSEYVQYGTAAYMSGHNTQGFAHLATNAWHTGGSWNFSGAGSMIQLDDIGKIRFYSHDGNGNFSENMILDGAGNLGLGTSNPTEKIDVNGGIKIANTAGTTAGTIRWTGTDFEGHDGTDWKSFTTGGAGAWSTSGTTIFYTDGHIGIGTTAPQYPLDVSGTIRACEVEVNNLDGWCDYVFEEDYKLASLEEVESYIKTNKHLMDIPSEAEVMAHGVSLNDMTKGLLKKVEELTLYMIEKDKQVKVLLERIETLEKNQ